MTHTTSLPIWQTKLTEALRMYADWEAEQEAKAVLNNPEFDTPISNKEVEAQIARSLEQIAAYERERAPIRTVVADGVAIIKKGLAAAVAWLEVSNDGLERLRRVYTPAILDGDAALSLETALEAAGLTVAPVRLAVSGDRVRLALRWRQDIPPQSPQVAVHVGGQLRPTAVVEWMDWNADAASTQGVRLRVDLDEAQIAALQAADGTPVLICQWSADTNTLTIDLLPRADADDD